MNRIPSEETALKLLEKAGCSRRVVDHCRSVAAFAVEIAETCKAKGLDVNVDLVRAGALLHDIGRGKTHSIFHALVGANLARKLNIPENVVFIIERHVGSGITEGEAEKLGFPVRSYVPETLEERIVAYADKLIEGSNRIPVDAAVERFRKDESIPQTSVQRLKQWHEELSPCRT